MSNAAAAVGFGLARGLAIFIALFSLLNVLGDRLTPGFDANLWWIDLRLLPRALGNAALMAFAAGLAAWIARPGVRGVRVAALATLIIPAGAVLLNIVTFVRLAAGHRILAGFPVPFSAIVLLALLGVAWALLRPAPPLSPRTHGASAAAVAACIVAFPLLQMYCFGWTDYRQPADVAVVFGARAYRDGTPSQALADRVRTACELYRQGLVSKLIFSGGPGDGAIDEPETMRRFALTLGVRSEDILLDPHGLNTAATVANTAPLFDRLAARRVLAVSHAYHLPRVKMAYRRAGREVYTVPARQLQPLSSMPRLMLREVVALWGYYLTPLTGRSLQERA